MDLVYKVLMTSFVLVLLAAALVMEIGQHGEEMSEDIEEIQHQSCAEQYRWVGDGTIDLEDVSSRCLADDHDPDEMGEDVTTREEAFRKGIGEAIEETID